MQTAIQELVCRATWVGRFYSGPAQIREKGQRKSSGSVFGTKAKADARAGTGTGPSVGPGLDTENRS
jgi:hypothetical protein